MAHIYYERRPSIEFLYWRDKGICGICGQPVARKNASRDHIIPRSQGGPHDAFNMRLAHKKCNMRRGDPDLAFLLGIG